jgi:hypothetical protein
VSVTSIGIVAAQGSGMLNRIACLGFLVVVGGCGNKSTPKQEPSTPGSATANAKPVPGVVPPEGIDDLPDDYEGPRHLGDSDTCAPKDLHGVYRMRYSHDQVTHWMRVEVTGTPLRATLVARLTTHEVYGGPIAVTADNCELTFVTAEGKPRGPLTAKVSLDRATGALTGPITWRDDSGVEVGQLVTGQFDAKPPTPTNPCVTPGRYALRVTKADWRSTTKGRPTCLLHELDELRLVVEPFGATTAITLERGGEDDVRQVDACTFDVRFVTERIGVGGRLRFDGTTITGEMTFGNVTAFEGNEAETYETSCSATRGTLALVTAPPP